MKIDTKFGKILIIVLYLIWMILEASLMNTSQIAATRWEIVIISCIQLIIGIFIGVLATIK